MIGMNKKNIWALGLLAAAFVGGFSSCDDDDDDSAKLNHKDPRVRTMSIAGIRNSFIINDVEGLIYNYDSLSFGADLKALHPVFSGYQVRTPIFYDSAGVWKSYPSDTTFKLDFSNKVKIRSLSFDSTQFIDYDIDIRVHKFDVESFEWKPMGNAQNIDSIINAKTVFMNEKYHYFCETAQGTSHLISADGAQWAEASAPQIEAPTDWSTLTVFNGKLYVSANGTIYEADEMGAFSVSPLQSPDGFDAAKPLFVLGKRLWAMTKNAESIALCYAQAGDSTFTVGETIDETISFDETTAILSASGITDLGYIFSPDENGNSIVLSVDKQGAIVRPAKGATFAYRKGMTIFNHENLLCAMGGINADGTYSNQTFSSTDSGLSWKENTHRIMPGNGQFSHASVFASKEANNILLIGGNTGNGASIAWKGVLKQFIMDEMLYGKN